MNSMKFYEFMKFIPLETSRQIRSGNEVNVVEIEQL